MIKELPKARPPPGSEASPTAVAASGHQSSAVSAPERLATELCVAGGTSPESPEEPQVLAQPPFLVDPGPTTAMGVSPDPRVPDRQPCGPLMAARSAEPALTRVWCPAPVRTQTRYHGLGESGESPPGGALAPNTCAVSRPPETRKLMYVFDGLPVRSGLELVSAMRQRWADATDLLDAWPDPTLNEWLRARPDGNILVLALDMEKSGGSRLIRLQAEFDPDGPLEFQGAPVDDKSLERAIHDADPLSSETGANLSRFVQIEIERPKLEARVDTSRPTLSSQLRAYRLDSFAGDIVREIDSIGKSQLQSARDRLLSIEEETKSLQSSPAVKAYQSLSSMASPGDSATLHISHGESLAQNFRGHLPQLIFPGPPRCRPPRPSNRGWIKAGNRFG